MKIATELKAGHFYLISMPQTEMGFESVDSVLDPFATDYIPVVVYTKVVVLTHKIQFAFCQESVFEITEDEYLIRKIK
tara:strand:- start:1534 stop:1767 length:234 start_codon:yes stop_codon:yes gene_type:complete